MSAMNKPRIRFKGYTDDWEQRKFGDLADYKKGPFGSTLKKDMFVPRNETTVKVYEQQNAINKDWTLERYFITKEYAQKLSGFKVEGGNIIVSCAGTIGEIYEIPMDAESGIINQALMRIKVDEFIVHKKMFLILFTNMIDDFTRVHSNGSAIKNIPPFSDLKPMEVLIPKMEEQKKISEYITNLEYLITLHQRKCEETKTLKKYMLQKMFPQNGANVPEIRFNGFNDSWEQRKLGEVAKYRNGKAHENEIDIDGEYIVVNSKFVSTDGEVRKYSNSQNEPLYKNEITFVLSDVPNGRAIARTFLVDKSNKYTLNQRIAGITPLEKTAPYYLHIRMNRNQYFLKFDDGNKQTNLSINDVMNYEDMYPGYEEQKKIAAYFRTLDHLITLHQRKLEMLQKIKKSMLEKMFV